MKIKTLILCSLIFSSEYTYSQWNKKREKNKTKLVLSDGDRKKFDHNFFEALKQKHLENYEDALVLFEKCIKIDPNAAAPLYEAAKIYKNLTQGNLALEYSLKAYKLNEANETYAYLCARLLSKQKKYQQAKDIYKSLTKINKKSEIYFYELADIYILSNDFKGAIKTYNELESIIGINKILSLQKHKIYMQILDVENGNNELLRLIEEFPGDTDVLEILAEGYLLNNEKEKAFEIFKNISNLDKDNGRVHLMLYDHYKSIGENEKAFEELARAFESSSLSIDGKIPVLVSYLNLLQDSSYKAQAFSLCRKIVKAHPLDPKSYAVFGDLLYEDRQLDSAEVYYNEVLKIDKSKPQIWTQLIFVNAERNEYDKVLNITEEALLYFPTNAVFYYFNGISLLRKKEYTASINIFNQGIEYVFDNNILLNEFYNSLAECYNETKEYKSSDSLFELSLKINPSNPTVLNNYSYYLSLRGVNLEKAKEMSFNSNLLEPNNGTFQDTYAWILYKLQQYDEALSWIVRAVENGSRQSPVVLEHYGDILYRLNRKNEAFEKWEQAKAFGKGSELLEKKIREKKLYE